VLTAGSHSICHLEGSTKPERKPYHGPNYFSFILLRHGRWKISEKACALVRKPTGQFNAAGHRASFGKEPSAFCLIHTHGLYGLTEIKEGAEELAFCLFGKLSQQKSRTGGHPRPRPPCSRVLASVGETRT